MILAPLASFLVSVTVFQRRDRVYGLKICSFSVINTGYGKEPVASKEHNVQSKSPPLLGERPAQPAAFAVRGRRRGNDDANATDRCRHQWLFGICLGSNRGEEWQAAETGKAVDTNGLQAGRNGQGDQAVGRRLCDRDRASRYHFPCRAKPASADPRSKSRCKAISDHLVESG
jgi:hypothetical protein